MDKYKYGFKIEVIKYLNGQILFGANFNTNIDYGEEEREYYLCLYLFKIGIFIGKFH